MKMKKEEKEQLLNRNKELIELIQFDPNNRGIYENELIENNMRLVSVVLQKYAPYTEDDFQCGCIGLIIAAKTFDVSRKVSFAGYACFLIERELHRAHKNDLNTFESRWQENGGAFIQLDSQVDCGGDSRVSLAETITDELAETDFIKLLDDFELSHLFEAVVYPALDKMTQKKVTGQVYEPETWKKLEISLLLDIADIEPLKEKITFSAMSKVLGISVTNIKKKHQRVLDLMREYLEKEQQVCMI